jgi:protein O-GlcNAc transferase
MHPQLTSRRLAITILGIAALAPSLAQTPVSANTLRQADTLYRAGTAALNHNDLTAAQSDFEQVIRLMPSAEPAHVALGIVFANRGHLQEAIHQYQLALSLRKSDTTAQLNLGIAYQRIGQPAKAIALFTQMESDARLHHQSLSAPALSAYAHALAAAGNLARAAIEMKAAVQADPRNPQLHDELGSIYAQQASWESARKEFAAAIELDSQLPAPHLHLGLALQALHQPDSLSQMEQAHALAADNPTITLELALAYQRANRAEDAIDLFQKILDIDPSNDIAATDLGMALLQAQRAKDAVPTLQHAIQLSPESVTAHEDLAAAYVQLNQFDDAEAELHTALKLAPDRPQLHYDLGLAYKMQDDATHAIPEFEAAEKLDPQQPESPYALGLLYLQAGRYADAARELKMTLSLRPENAQGWATLGSVDNQLNQLPEAVDALQHAIQQTPDQPDPHLTLANVLIKQDKLADATEQRKLAANLMRSNMNRQRAEVATHSGSALLKTGDLAGAAVQFNHAINFDPTYADAHQGLAKVYDAMGKPADAAAERAKATQAHP